LKSVVEPKLGHCRDPLVRCGKELIRDDKDIVEGAKSAHHHIYRGLLESLIAGGVNPERWVRKGQSGQLELLQCSLRTPRVKSCLNAILCILTKSAQTKGNPSLREVLSSHRPTSTYRRQFAHDGLSLLHFRFLSLQKVQAFSAMGVSSSLEAPVIS
jgi:hypothetical protein